MLRGEECNIEDIRTKLGGKLVVKPSTEGSALGVSIVDNGDDLACAIDTALELAPSVLVEQFISGRELTVAVLGGRSLAFFLPLK